MLKGMGPISLHLGCDFFCDRNGVLCFYPQKYTDNMVHTYITMFGSKLKLNKAVRSPFGKLYHPDIYTS